MRRLIGAAVIIIGAGAFAACLRSVLAGVRDVMIKDGGSCGSGGPYVIAHQCSGGDIRLLLVGILGGLVAVAIYGSGTAALSRSAALACWAAGFGTLGGNFISLFIHPPVGQGRSTGWLISGIVFLALALGGLAPLVTGLMRGLRPGPRPTSVSRPAGPPIVPAVIPPGVDAARPATFGSWLGSGTTALGVTGTPVDLAPRRPQRQALASVGIWLATSAVGAAIGLFFSSSLVSALR